MTAQEPITIVALAAMPTCYQPTREDQRQYIEEQSGPNKREDAYVFYASFINWLSSLLSRAQSSGTKFASQEQKNATHNKLAKCHYNSMDEDDEVALMKEYQEGSYTEAGNLPGGNLKPREEDITAINEEQRFIGFGIAFSRDERLAFWTRDGRDLDEFDSISRKKVFRAKKVRGA